MNEQEFSIQDLCDQTGLPRRTIHFYTQQGIIPPPVSSGLGARYQRIHLVRLSLIPVLRQQGLRLDDIRQKFQVSSPVELDKLLSGSQNSVLAPDDQPAPAPISFQAVASQSYRVYHLSRGVVVMAPNHLSQGHLAKITNLCHTIEKELAKDVI